jgi:hypothetical protein
MSLVCDRWYGPALAVVLACSTPTSAPAPSSTVGSAVATEPVAAPARPAPFHAAQITPIPVAHHASTVVVMDEPKIDLPKQESFKLLEAGKQPRAALRYHLAPDSFAFHAKTTLSSRHLTNGAFTQPIELPAIRDGFTVTIAADGHGQVALRGLPGEAASPSADADEYLHAWRTLLQDRAMTIAIDPRGQVTVPPAASAADTRSEPARDELVQRLLSTTIPLPTEPIGNGASWRVVTILKQRPGHAKQTATYTLVSAAPTRWKLHVVLQRVGEEQAIADPSLPPTVTAELMAMFRLLEGDVEIDPRRPLIAAGSLTVESRLHVKLQPTGQPAIEQMFEDTGTVALSQAP